MAQTTYFINGRFLSQPITGVQRYAIETVKALDRMMGLEDKCELILLVPKRSDIKNKFKHIQIKYVGLFTGHLWEQLELPLYARNGVLINLCNVAPLLKHNQLVCIHDAAVFSFPKAYSFIFRSWYKFLLIALTKRVKKVITVSNFSKHEISRYCKISENELQVIYEGKEHLLDLKSDYSIIEKHNLANRKYLLAVSSLNPNKNFDSIIHAIKLIDKKNFEIVIAGGKNAKIFGNIKLENFDKTRYIGYVSDQELKALYENATCFVYPSFYEGFGLPPLEAMACGCPVIVSNAASLPEICGEGALYCNPYSAEDIANKIETVMNDELLRLKLRRKGLERTLSFSWEKCARKVFKLISCL